MAKKKSGGSKGPSSAGIVLAVGLACAGGGYYAGKNSETIERKLAELTSGARSDAPAPQPAKPAPAPAPKHAEAPAHAVKPADKVELSRILRGGEPKAATPTPPAKPDLSPRPEVASKADASPKPDLSVPPPLGVALLEKQAAQGAEDGDRLILSVGFENLAGKPIRAFEGVLRFTDQQNNSIFSSKISVSALISDGATLQWEQHVDAKKLDNKGKRLIGEDKDNLKAVFLVKKIFFVDGSVQKYAARF